VLERVLKRVLDAVGRLEKRYENAMRKKGVEMLGKTSKFFADEVCL